MKGYHPWGQWGDRMEIQTEAFFMCRGEGNWKDLTTINPGLSGLWPDHTGDPGPSLGQGP